MGHDSGHGMRFEHTTWLATLLRGRLGALVGEGEGWLSNQGEENLSLVALSYQNVRLIWNAN